MDKVINHLDQSQVSPSEAQEVSRALAQKEADRIEKEQATAQLNSDKVLATIIAEVAAMGIREPIEPLLHSQGHSVVIDKSSGIISVLKPSDSLAILNDDIEIVQDSEHRDHALLAVKEFNPTETTIDLGKLDKLITSARKAGDAGQELATRLEMMVASQMSQEVL